MSETISHASNSGTSSTCTPTPCVPSSLDAVPHPRIAATPSARPHRFRSRIGVGLAGGFYPAPHRYELYLSAHCPLSLRVSITHGLLGLKDSVATTLLALPADTPSAFASLRGAYEATWHHYDGPLTAPALCDRWSGRVVSNHTPDILRDLGDLFADRAGSCHSPLRPAELAADIDALRDLLDRDVTPGAPPQERSAALDLLNGQLAAGPYALGKELTAADVDLWVALVPLEAAQDLSSYALLQDYVRRLDAHPAFHRHL
ncbi:glutathione S-transferase C-terminal domain-containing protein [Streptomyces sp. NPDC087263]|uniref:glutathione S-transferase C-terminal domain-containing protein n=1 Tax=Streptomyces sp. NPDC087263 TaxID=3365773 RepID=UPI0038162EDF